MTDSRLLQLKRAWEASGSVEDEAAWLRERVRTGELSRERLELAAWCGCQGALQASKRWAVLATTLRARADDAPGRASGLEAWGQRVVVEFGLLLAQDVGQDPLADAAIAAARAWLECPCDEHSEEAAMSAMSAIVTDDPATRLCGFVADSAGVDAIDAAQGGGTNAVAAGDLENAAEHYVKIKGPAALLAQLRRFGHAALTDPPPQPTEPTRD